MTFHNVRLPEKYSKGATGGPMFMTKIVGNTSGFENRNGYWTEPLHRYQIGHNIKTPAAMAELTAFFLNRSGRLHSFRFKDWTDYQGTNEPIGTGDGADTTFQLIKRYSDGSYNHDRRITKPVTGTVVVNVSGSPVTVNSVSDTGVVTLAAAPAAAAPVTATFEFDVPVRFDVDIADVVYEAPGARSWPDIPLMEVRIA